MAGTGNNNVGFGMTMAQSRPTPEAFDDEDDYSFFNSFVEQINKKLLVTLRDGRTLIGILSSLDLWSNMVLTEASERIYVDKMYGDVERGLMMVRGDNLVVAGEFDTAKDEISPLQKVSEQEILKAQRKQQYIKDIVEQRRTQAFKLRGLKYVPHNRDSSAFL